MSVPFRESAGALLLDLRVTPGASKSLVEDVREGRLRVKIAAAPEDGKANAALREFMAKTLGCPKRDVELVGGQKSRAKTLKLPASCRSALERLTAAGAGA